jgi:hypothetical protein
MIILYLLESFLVIYMLQTCRDYSFDFLFMINVLRTCHDHPIFVRIILVIYVLRTCRHYLLDCLFALIKM